MEPGERIAILGGGLIGCETAEYFASMGRQVEIFEMRDDVAVELTESRRIFMLKRLKELEIPIHTGTRVEEIALPRLTVSDGQGEKRQMDGFDSVIVAAGRRPESGLLEEVREALPGTRVYTAGDANVPGLAIEAVHEAAFAAAEILREFA